nr:immunoglobulin heavy chain junction region [Mus musculus]
SVQDGYYPATGTSMS